jgi:tetratricopeptide (TPR) repeat protein
MFHTSWRRALLVAAGVAALSAIQLAAQTQTQPKPKDDPARKEAFRVFNSGKYVEAMPMLENYVTAHPDDFVAKEDWAYSVLQYAATLTNADDRKKARARARALAVELKQAGDQSDVLQVLLALPEDGAEGTFSSRKDVDEAIKAAEADFNRGDFDKARAGYQKVLALEPNNYEAVLYTGDAYFSQKQYEKANEWFARAAAIDPNREMAYRYWGDALVSLSKDADARGKFIDAVIAEPYVKESWIALRKWADRNKVKLNVVVLKDKSSAQTHGKNTTVTVDPAALGKDTPAAAAWIAYSGVRISWQKDKFKKEFPSEPTYRHSLKEEAAALDTMAKVVAEDSKDKKRSKDLDPALVSLVAIDDSGFLDPFVLYNRYDSGIAKDYPAYRDAHRDVLRRYLDEYVVPKAPN